jgi:TonB family protein
VLSHGDGTHGGRLFCLFIKRSSIRFWMFQFHRAITSLFGGLCAGLILSTAASAAPHQTSGPKITYVSGPEVRAMFIKFGRMHYPWLARQQYRSGNGTFRVYINPDGKVRTVGVVRSTGHQDLDLAAAAGLYQCVFKPGRRRELDLPVTFMLGRSSVR